MQTFLSTYATGHATITISLCVGFKGNGVRCLSPSLTGKVGVKIPPSATTVFSKSKRVVHVTSSSSTGCILLPFSTIVDRHDLDLSLETDGPYFRPAGVRGKPFVDTLRCTILEAICAFYFSSNVQSVASRSNTTGVYTTMSDLGP